MAKKMNVQIAAWCHFYWKSINPGGERFYGKLSDRAFNQVMLHEISECEWDDKTKTITSPTTRSELSAVIEFENQDWVKNLTQANNSVPKKNFVDPNAAFPFQDDFSLGTIHWANMKARTKDKNDGDSEVIEIANEEDNVSVLTTKTQDELLALLLQERRKSKSVISRRAASGTDTLVSGPTANNAPAGETGTTRVAAKGLQIPTDTGNEGMVDGGPARK
jgi:hypothetical protein